MFRPWTLHRRERFRDGGILSMMRIAGSWKTGRFAA